MLKIVETAYYVLLNIQWCWYFIFNFFLSDQTQQLFVPNSKKLICSLILFQKYLTSIILNNWDKQHQEPLKYNYCSNSMSVSFKIENWKCPGNYGIVKSGYVAFLWGEPWLQSLEEYCMEFLGWQGKAGDWEWSPISSWYQCDIIYLFLGNQPCSSVEES